MGIVAGSARRTEGERVRAFGQDLSATWRVLFFPGATFREIRERQPLLAPWLVVSALSVILSLGVLSISQRAVAHLMEGFDSAAFAEQMQASLDRARFISVAASPISLFLRWAATALVLWSAGVLVAGGAPYRAVLSIVAYSSPPVVLGQGIDLAVNWIEGPEFTAEMVPVFSSATSLGALLPAAVGGPWTDALLGNLSVPSGWAVVLWMIGLRASFGWGWARATAIAAPVGALFWAVSSALEVMSRSAMGAVGPG